jgi:putative anaerobic ribonucleoside-triphosphate reductase activating protein
MSILVPVVSTGITLNEVPDHVAFYFEIGNCTQNCPHCHSPHLTVQHTLAFTSIEDMERMAEHAAEQGATAIAVMGGTTNGISDDDLITILSTLGDILPVCLYSGSDNAAYDKGIAGHAGIRWLKTGAYHEELGGLSSPTTNQRFYRLEKRYCYNIFGQYVHSTFEFIDRTHLFQQKGDT